MTNLDDNFFKTYLNRPGFWYSFKRSVGDIGNLFLLFRYLQVFEGLNWNKQQKEFSNILIKEKLLFPSKHSNDSSANSRGIKKVFELLGLCYVNDQEKLQITSIGKKFLQCTSNDELYEIKTNQLLKYQINNPLIKSKNFAEMQIKPFPFLLKLLVNLENQSISTTEFKLFLSRAHNIDEFENILELIKNWRNLGDVEKDKIKNKLTNSSIYEKISGYSGYSMVFFGKSSFTEITEYEDENVIYLKQDKIEQIKQILKNDGIYDFQPNLDSVEDFMSYYGTLDIDNLEEKDNKIEFTTIRHGIAKLFKNIAGSRGRGAAYKELGTIIAKAKRGNKDAFNKLKIKLSEIGVALKDKAEFEVQKITEPKSDKNTNLKFGEIDNIKLGRIFKNRDELSKYRIHGPTMAGIWGRENEGASSIVLSGGYEDDIDDYSYILYTGHGGQDKPGGKQVKDQEFVKGNKALTINYEKQIPVRVTRGYQIKNGPSEGYRYDGIYYVNKYERIKGKNKLYVCRFHLSREKGKYNLKINNNTLSQILKNSELIKKKDIVDKKLSKLDNITILLKNRKLEDLFFLSGRTLNVLKNEQIIYLKDLLIWEKSNLKQMQGMGGGSVDELIEQLSVLNERYNTNLDFAKSAHININEKIANLNQNLFKRLDEIDFSIRTMNVFKNENLTHFGDLVQKTENDLLRMPNFGRKSLIEIKNVLDELSLYLGMEINWPPEDEKIYINEKKFSNTEQFNNLSEDDKINFFRPITEAVDNVRVLNYCNKININFLGDLHQQIETKKILEVTNLGRRSIELMKITLFKYISIPFYINITDWNEIRNVESSLYLKKLSDKQSKENSKEFENLKYLDDEIDLLMKKVNFSRQDIINYHYGLDGTGPKTLQDSGDKFGITRERIRQITVKYLRIVSKKKIDGLIILKKIEENLKELTPITLVEFEKYLLNNSIVKKRYSTKTIFSLFDIFLNKNNFYFIKGKIIENKNNPKYSKFFKYVFGSLNNYGCIKIAYLTKKFSLTSNQIFDLLSLEDDISFIGQDWLYDNDKSRNRLFNTLQKIFNVSPIVNKFQISQALKRVRRIQHTPPYEAVAKYCKKELKATIDDFQISIPSTEILKYRFNTQIEYLTPVDKAIIDCFSNNKILHATNFTNKLIDKGINPNTSSQMISINPLITKVNPACYSLIGTKLEPGEAEIFFNKNKGRSKIITDYDHTDDGRIWIGYEINERTRSGRNFPVSNSIYEILKGKYNVKGMNHEINIRNKIIGKVSNEIFKNKLKLGEEIVFTFDTNKKKVDIEIGERAMKAKYS